MNMFKPVNAKTIAEYMDMLPAERRKPLEFLHALIQKAAPTFTPSFLYNMPGYGSFKYKNVKKELLDWPVVAVASQKIQKKSWEKSSNLPPNLPGWNRIPLGKLHRFA